MTCSEAMAAEDRKFTITNDVFPRIARYIVYYPVWIRPTIVETTDNETATTLPEDLLDFRVPLREILLTEVTLQEHLTELQSSYITTTGVNG